MSDNIIKDLPDKKELEKLSEKERKSFFRSIFKKVEEDSKTTDDGKEKMPVEDKTAVLEELKKDGRFAQLDELLPRMEKLLEAFPELNSIEMGDRYRVAYFVIMGADAAAKTEKKPTPRQLVDALLSDPAAIKLYETVRTSEIAEKNGAYPAHSASKGAASMPANVKNAPKNLNEARKEAYGYFGINN